MKTFFVMSLPRSRTAWFANFLTHENSFCFHEAFLQVRSPNQLRELFASTGKEIVGNSDCGNLFFVDEILDAFPDAKFIVIERPVEDVLASIRSLGPEFSDEETVWHAYDRLREFKRQHNPLIWQYDHLSLPSLALIWQHCIGTRFDVQRASMLDGLDIQINLDKKLRQIREIEDKRWLMEALN